MRNDPTRAAALERRLSGCPGIRHVSASPATGSILVLYDPTALTLEHLEMLLCQPALAEAAAAAAILPETPITNLTGADGLSSAEVECRRMALGLNVVPEPPRPSFMKRFLKQYRDVMQLTLVAGAGLSLLSGHRRDALTIGAVLLLNGLIGASQDGGTSRSVAALRSLGGQPARVVRDGREQVVPAAELVPGDLLLLEEGDRIPADAHVVRAVGLAVDESLLTGECAAVEKSSAASMLSAGTCVVRGRGQAMVTATGATSALGRIAALLEREERPPPLQRHLNGMGRRLARAGLWLGLAVTGLGLLRGQPMLGALMSGASLVISAVPEGLPAFVTLALAAGARRMSQRNAEVQNLAALETLGTVTTLCCDKTGTLTEGEMSVTELHLPDNVWQVSGEGYAPSGEFRRLGKRANPLADSGLRRLLQASALCTNARLGVDDQGALVTRGDTTELALLVTALKAGIRAMGGEGDRVLEVPFDSERRRMVVVCRDGAGRAVACAKGAPEALLPMCTEVLTQGAVRRMDLRLRRRFNREAANMASRGLRVLAVGYRPVSLAVSPEDAERGLILLGLVGMADAPRSEALETVRRCHEAGVRVIMITGDHPATASAIAAQVGISVQTGSLLTGEQLDQMDDRALEEATRCVTVVARATPEQKLRVVRALRRTGQVVAMTGDGVNDAPAMREADVGIAMGDRGTEVARAAASLVLHDDNLTTLLSAIEQGRATRGNIRRTARYLLGSNAAEVCLMAGALLLGLPLPLLPVQLLWMNLVGDGLPASALGTQPAAPGLMRRPPERSGELMGPGFGRSIAGHGLLAGLAATALFAWALASGRSLPQARTLAMVTLAAGQVRHLHACRSQAGDQPVRRAGAIAAAMALGAVYFPPLRGALQLAPLGLGDLALAAGVGFMGK